MTSRPPIPALLACLLIGSALPATAEELSPEAIRAATAIDTAAILANEATTPNWPTHGLDHAETRFSKLARINTGNVGELGLAWS